MEYHFPGFRSVNVGRAIPWSNKKEITYTFKEKDKERLKLGMRIGAVIKNNDGVEDYYVDDGKFFILTSLDIKKPISRKDLDNQHPVWRLPIQFYKNGVKVSSALQSIGPNGFDNDHLIRPGDVISAKVEPLPQDKSEYEYSFSLGSFLREKLDGDR